MQNNQLSADVNNLDSKALFRQFLETWIEQASGDLVDAVYYAAIPHRFDLTIFNTFYESTADLDLLIEQLIQMGFVIGNNESSDDHRLYYVQSVFREILLQQWQTDFLDTYRLANAKMAQFYQDNIIDNNITPLQFEYTEYIYHQMGADETKGLPLLTTTFEQLWQSRQWGVIEQLLNYIDEQRPVLTEGTQAWLTYFRARLDLQYGHLSEGEQALSTLLSETSSTLQARTLITLADVYIQTQRWAKGIENYAKAQALFEAEGDQRSIALVLEVEGNAFVKLATDMGGLPEGLPERKPLFQTWRHRCQHAPFLLYRWFSRRFVFFPSLYFGTNYQDWVIIRLLHEAIIRYEKSLSHLMPLLDGTDESIRLQIIDIEIRLADLYHNVERWQQAENLLAELDLLPAIQQDDYRRATLRQVQGRSKLSRKDWQSSRIYLQEAKQIFTRYNDFQALGRTCHLLGDVALAMDQTEGAVQHYMTSIQAMYTAHDLLSTTHYWAKLKKIYERFDLNSETREQIESIEEQQLENQAYIARFPGKLYQRFRNIALYTVLPLSYLVTWVLAIVLCAMGLILEALAHYFLGQSDIVYVELIRSAIVSIFPLVFIIPLSVWIYELFYVALGGFFVRFLSLWKIEWKQPEYVITTPESIVIRKENGIEQKILWESVSQSISMNHALRNSSIGLMSHMALITQQTKVILAGVISHYGQLQKNIQKHLHTLENPPTEQNLNFSFFNDSSTVGTWGLILFMTLMTLFDFDFTFQSHNLIPFRFTGAPILNLYFISFVSYFCFWTLSLFPPLGFLRLLRNRMQIQKALGKNYIPHNNWVLWGVISLFILWAFVWIRALVA